MVSRAGLWVLGGFADRVGLAGCLSAALPPAGERAPVHDRGALLTHLCLVLAAGGEACSDVGRLRGEPELFGPVASAATLWRAVHAIDEEALARVWRAAKQVRERVWARAAPQAGLLVVDVDSTLVEVRSDDKQRAAARF